ncbi:MAG: hypothetical protein HYZ29_36105 [Myxococcales bacterium]|nr:hypothetical protein [Myxococcales bacterium]
MPNFGELFKRSKGQAVSYEGQTLVMLDRFPAKLGETLLVTIESTDASWPQGVGMSDGVELFGVRERRAVVWEYFSVPPEERASVRSRLPFSFEVKCRNKRGSISFYNVTELDGRQEWWHGGACMIVDEIPNGRRYLCNDFELDDDFNDLVFTVIRASEHSA